MRPHSSAPQASASGCGRGSSSVENSASLLSVDEVVRDKVVKAPSLRRSASPNVPDHRRPPGREHRNTHLNVGSNSRHGSHRRRGSVAGSHRPGAPVACPCSVVFNPKKPLTDVLVTRRTPRSARVFAASERYILRFICELGIKGCSPLTRVQREEDYRMSPCPRARPSYASIPPVEVV